MSKLIELSNRCERASGPDRTLDLAISAGINYEGVFESGYSHRWSVMSDEIVAFGEDNKRQYRLDPVQFVPRWTESLDQAVRLLPVEWFWQVGRTSSFQAWAMAYKNHPDHNTDGVDEFFARRSYHEPKWTPVLALCAVALRARAGKVGGA